MRVVRSAARVPPEPAGTVGAVSVTEAAPPVAPARPNRGRGRRSTRAVLAQAADAQAGAEDLAAIVRSGAGGGRRGVRGGARAAGVGRDREDVDRGDQGHCGRPARGWTSCRPTAYFTVADVLRAGPDRLVGVPGIGEGTARKAVARRRAAPAGHARLAAVPHRVRPERRPASPGCCRRWPSGARCATPPRRTRHRPTPRRPSSRPNARSPRRPAVGPVAPAVHAAPRPGGRRRGGAAGTGPAAPRPSPAGCCGRRRTSGRCARPAPAEVWRDFEQRSAAYYGLLGQVVGLGGDVAAAEGYLPADIVERVNAQRLDTSRLNESLRLRGYQSFGARFALVQRRVVLGDEMGLGKTVQAIATMGHLAANGATHFLVVCPASVLINWTREIAQHSTLPVHRPARQRPGPGRGALARRRAASP